MEALLIPVLVLIALLVASVVSGRARHTRDNAAVGNGLGYMFGRDTADGPYEKGR